jgi:hypothetical protein
MRIVKIAIIFIISFAGCAYQPQNGMIIDSRTGLALGSIVEKNIFLDSSQFLNRSIKISIRNISGDQSYNLESFYNNLENAFSRKGYIPVSDDNFGIKLDINVLYSGLVRRNLAARFGFLAGAAGGIVGHNIDSGTGTAAGILSGVTLGSIIGSYVTDDTYIIITEVSIGVTDSLDNNHSNKKTITFSSSPKMQEEDIPQNFRPFREVLRTKIAVFAGGRNIRQQQITEQVKQRLVNIVCNII